jgi:hypothetical protein
VLARFLTTHNAHHIQTQIREVFVEIPEDAEVFEGRGGEQIVVVQSISAICYAPTPHTSDFYPLDYDDKGWYSSSHTGMTFEIRGRIPEALLVNGVWYRKVPTPEEINLVPPHPPIFRPVLLARYDDRYLYVCRPDRRVGSKFRVFRGSLDGMEEVAVDSGTLQCHNDSIIIAMLGGQLYIPAPPSEQPIMFNALGGTVVMERLNPDHYTFEEPVRGYVAAKAVAAAVPV